jgi:tyrosine-protein kinase Etk/Wzc
MKWSFRYFIGKIDVIVQLKLFPIGFDFISRGMVPPNPAELLMHRRFDELIDWASQNYDIVILIHHRY